MDPETTLSSTEPTHSADFVTYSQLAVPITHQVKKLGVRTVVNKTGEANYTEESVAIPETLASQAAIAFQKSHGTNLRHRRSSAP